MTPQAAGALRLPCDIKVVNCCHPTYWWSKHLGQVFLAVLYRPESGDLLLENGECILLEDVEIPARR